MSGSLHWSSCTICLSLLMYFKCNPPQQLKFLSSHQFYNSLILTTVYCSCCNKKNLLTLCTVYYSILCSTALHFLSKLHLNTNPNFRLTKNVLNKNCLWTTHLQNVSLIILKLQPMGSQAVLKLSFVTSLEGKPPLLEQVLPHKVKIICFSIKYRKNNCRWCLDNWSNYVGAYIS